MIGQMKDRLNAKTLAKVSNGRGGWTHEEIDIGTVWARVRDLGARNIVQFRQADMNTNTEIVIRANDKITRETVFYGLGNRYEVEDIVESNGYYTISAVGETLGKE
jgi:SPP1 family predicted phage head-tail adaptor